MVLIVKEKEEAIFLLAMDPQVCAKLLTLHRRGNGVDVEALRDRIPLRRSPEKAPRWDLTGTKGCGGGKMVSWLPWKVLGYLRIYRRKKQVGGVTRGPQGWGARRASRPCGHLVASLTCTPSPLDVFWSKKNHHESFILFGLHLVFLFCETLKQGKKQELALGSRLIGQSQK